MLDIKKYMYFESKSRFRFFLLTLIDNQSNENHPYTYQGLISIGKRSSFYDLYICIQSKYITLTYRKHAFIWVFFNTLQSGCYNHYFFFFRKYAKISFSVSYWRNQIDFLKLFLVRSLVVWRWPPILSDPYRCKQKEDCFNNNPFWFEAVTENLLVASNELGSSILKLFIRYVILTHIFICRHRGRVIFFSLLVVLNVSLI